MDVGDLANIFLFFYYSHVQQSTDKSMDKESQYKILSSVSCVKLFCFFSIY